jgi:hypothetical protein
MRTIFYYLGVAALFTHELDAVVNMEWRLLYHLRTLPDVTAEAAFIGMHLPMFFAFFYFGHHPKAIIRERFRLIIAIFLVVHSALHFRLSDDPLYQFEGVISNAYIYGATLFGLLFIILTLQHKKPAD